MQVIFGLLVLAAIFGASKLSWIFAALVGGVVFLAVCMALYEYMRTKDMSPDELAIDAAKRQAAEHFKAFGRKNLQLVCPHCHVKGKVRQKQVTVSSTTTGTIGGILKTNTSSVTKQAATQHHCDNCGTTWSI